MRLDPLGSITQEVSVASTENHEEKQNLRYDGFCEDRFGRLNEVREAGERQLLLVRHFGDLKEAHNWPWTWRRLLTRC